MLELDTAELIGRVALAVVLGGLVGLEREISRQPAGFRTHVAVALGSALFGLISIHAFSPFTGRTAETNVRVDVTRVASQVAVGVGFLGAGAILKEGGSVRGLTTAASLWTTAAIGLAVGVGYYGAAIAATVALLIALAVLRSVRRLVRRRIAREEQVVTFHLATGVDPGGIVTELHALAGVEVRGLKLDQDLDSRTVVIAATLRGGPGVDLDATLAALSSRPDVDEMYLGGRRLS